MLAPELLYTTIDCLKQIAQVLSAQSFDIFLYRLLRAQEIALHVFLNGLYNLLELDDALQSLVSDSPGLKELLASQQELN